MFHVAPGFRLSAFELRFSAPQDLHFGRRQGVVEGLGNEWLGKDGHRAAKKLALIAFFAQDVDDQIGLFRDLS
jgi:hypothetical protein